MPLKKNGEAKIIKVSGFFFVHFNTLSFNVAFCVLWHLCFGWQLARLGSALQVVK